MKNHCSPEQNKSIKKSQTQTNIKATTRKTVKPKIPHYQYQYQYQYQYEHTNCNTDTTVNERI